MLAGVFLLFFPFKRNLSELNLRALSFAAAVVEKYMKHEYRIWRVGIGESVVVGTVEAHEYLEARKKAEQLFGEQIEVYLAPGPRAEHTLAEVFGQFQPLIA